MGAESTHLNSEAWGGKNNPPPPPVVLWKYPCHAWVTISRPFELLHRPKITVLPHAQLRAERPAGRRRHVRPARFSRRRKIYDAEAGKKHKQLWGGSRPYLLSSTKSIDHIYPKLSIMRYSVTHLTILVCTCANFSWKDVAKYSRCRR